MVRPWGLGLVGRAVALDDYHIGRGKAEGRNKGSSFVVCGGHVVMSQRYAARQQSFRLGDGFDLDLSDEGACGEGECGVALGHGAAGNTDPGKTFTVHGESKKGVRLYISPLTVREESKRGQAVHFTLDGERGRSRFGVCRAS